MFNVVLVHLTRLFYRQICFIFKDLVGAAMPNFCGRDIFLSLLFLIPVKRATCHGQLMLTLRRFLKGDLCMMYVK